MARTKTVVVLGDVGVGKSTFIHQLSYRGVPGTSSASDNDNHSDRSAAYPTVDRRLLRVAGQTVSLLIVELGPEALHSRRWSECVDGDGAHDGDGDGCIADVFVDAAGCGLSSPARVLAAASAVICMYDVSKGETLECLEEMWNGSGFGWRQAAYGKLSVAVVANKVDSLLRGEEEGGLGTLTLARGSEFASRLQATHYELSTNTDMRLERVLKDVMERYVATAGEQYNAPSLTNVLYPGWERHGRTSDSTNGESISGGGSRVAASSETDEQLHDMFSCGTYDTPTPASVAVAAVGAVPTAQTKGRGEEDAGSSLATVALASHPLKDPFRSPDLLNSLGLCSGTVLANMRRALTRRSLSHPTLTTTTSAVYRNPTVIGQRADAPLSNYHSTSGSPRGGVSRSNGGLNDSEHNNSNSINGNNNSDNGVGGSSGSVTVHGDGGDSGAGVFGGSGEEPGLSTIVGGPLNSSDILDHVAAGVHGSYCHEREHAAVSVLDTSDGGLGVVATPFSVVPGGETGPSGGTSSQQPQSRPDGGGESGGRWGPSRFPPFSRNNTNSGHISNTSSGSRGGGRGGSRPLAPGPARHARTDGGRTPTSSAQTDTTPHTTPPPLSPTTYGDVPRAADHPHPATATNQATVARRRAASGAREPGTPLRCAGLEIPHVDASALHPGRAAAQLSSCTLM